MKKRGKDTINYSHIFNCAFYFYNASLRCWNVEKNTNNVSKTLFIPAMSNAAFACELAIKAIYYKIYHNQTVNQHDLYELLKLLPEKMVTVIITVLNDLGYNDAENIIKDNGKSFVEWRYVYEYEIDMFFPKFLLDFFRVLDGIYNTADIELKFT